MMSWRPPRVEIKHTMFKITFSPTKIRNQRASHFLPFSHQHNNTYVMLSENGNGYKIILLGFNLKPTLGKVVPGLCQQVIKDAINGFGYCYLASLLIIFATDCITMECRCNHFF